MVIERAGQDFHAARRALAVVAEPPLDEVVGRLIDALEPEQIHPFESRARGDGQTDSDDDLMVVVGVLTRRPTVGRGVPTGRSTASESPRTSWSGRARRLTDSCGSRIARRHGHARGSLAV
jgi:hypothetical protein